MRTLLLASLAAAAAGCTFASTVPEAATDYKPTGEIAYRGRNTTFDSVRVRSPTCNLTKRTDGSWGGTLGDRALDVSVTESMIRGVDVILSREDSTDGHVIITGQFQAKLFRFELDENQAIIRTPAMGLTFPGKVISENASKYGPMQELELRGEAGQASPPWPQIAFALLAAFN